MTSQMPAHIPNTCWPVRWRVITASQQTTMTGKQLRKVNKGKPFSSMTACKFWSQNMEIGSNPGSWSRAKPLSSVPACNLVLSLICEDWWYDDLQWSLSLCLPDSIFLVILRQRKKIFFNLLVSYHLKVSPAFHIHEHLFFSHHLSLASILLSMLC